MNLQFYVHLGIHDYKMQSLQRHQAPLHCNAYKNLFPERVSSGDEVPKIGSDCFVITVNQRLPNLLKAHLLHATSMLLA